MRRALLVLLAACSHAAPPPAAAPSKPAATCDMVSDHLVEIMSASSTASDDEMDPVRRIIARHCEQDLWTPQIQQCLLAAKTLPDSDHCETLLTPSQQDALSKENFGAKASPPPPAAAPAPATPPRPKTTDPCEGGE
jgi:hypothetical protein